MDKYQSQCRSVQGGYGLIELRKGSSNAALLSILSQREMRIADRLASVRKPRNVTGASITILPPAVIRALMQTAPLAKLRIAGTKSGAIRPPVKSGKK